MLVMLAVGRSGYRKTIIKSTFSLSDFHSPILNIFTAIQEFEGESVGLPLQCLLPNPMNFKGYN